MPAYPSLSTIKAACMLPLLFALAGCATINDTYSTSGGSIVPEFISNIGSGKSTVEKRSDAMTVRMMSVDQASDRMRARNELIVDLLDESDGLCTARLEKIAAKAQKWPLQDESEPDQLDSALSKGIAQRQYDKINPDMRLPISDASGHPGQTLAAIISKEIRKQRQTTRNSIENRLQMDIHQYSLKQSLEDVQVYHNSCRLDQGIASVAKATSIRMTAEERQAELDSLLQIRQTLMHQGLSTRAIQKKIDALIMAE